MTTSTASYMLDREQFTKFRTAFKALAAKRALMPADIMLYNLLRDLPKDRGFSAITNPRKLENGTDQWLGLKQAASHLKYMTKYRKADFNARFGLEFSDSLIAAIMAKGE